MSAAMPDNERRWLTILTKMLWAAALLLNIGHVQSHLSQAGVRGVHAWLLCWAPDILLLVGVWRLRYQPKHGVAWSMVILGMSWLVWAAISTVGHSPTARILSLTPIVVAVLVTLAQDFSKEPEPVPVPLVVKPKKAAPKPKQEPVEASVPAPVKVEPVTDATEKKVAPSRDACYQILDGYDNFLSISTAQLARTHGGSDRFWSARKKEYESKIAELTTEAAELDQRLESATS